MEVKDININDIKIVENVRVKIEKLEGLMQDIKQNGLYNAIKVAKTKANEFILVQGNRRLAACKKLGWKRIPATVVDDMELSDLLISNMAENVHREDISPIELGRICTRLKKDLQLSESEIAAKLSIPVNRVSGSIVAYNGLPAKHRNRVAFMGKGGSRQGNIPAGVALKIIATKRTYGLSDASVDKLLTVARMEEFGAAQLYIISLFLAQGLTVTQALEASKNFEHCRVDLVINNSEVEAALAKYKMDSKTGLLQSILYGELPPLKRPAFYTAKQLPAKL